MSSYNILSSVYPKTPSSIFKIGGGIGSGLGKVNYIVLSITICSITSIFSNFFIRHWAILALLLFALNLAIIALSFSISTYYFSYSFIYYFKFSSLV